MLHGLVDSDSVLWSHLVKLIDANDSAVSQHHGAALELELTGGVVLDDGRGQTSG